MADRLRNSSLLPTLDTNSHLSPALDGSAANLSPGLIGRRKPPPAAPRDPDVTDHADNHEKASVGEVGRVGLEPTTDGL